MGRSGSLVVAILLAIGVAGCGWTYPGYDAAATRNNPFESTITAANVSGLTEQWRAPATWGHVLVNKGRVYTTVGVPGPAGFALAKLVAYDLGGKAGCSGSPKICSPLLTFGDPGCNACFPGYGISGDTLYRWVGQDSPSGVAAFDAAGLHGCDSQTGVCEPVRTYSIPGVLNSPFGAIPPIVVDGRLYVVSSSGGKGVLSAFDANGVQSCTPSPVVCSSLWTTQVPSLVTNAPAISSGVAYLSTTTGVAAVDALGQTNCSGSPQVCLPLWVTSGTTPSTLSQAAVANHRLYVSNAKGLLVYDAGGVVGCASGVCAPLWASSGPGGGGGPLVANDRVYIKQSSTTLVAYDASGASGCHGVPVICDPISTANGFGDLLQATGANGLVVTTQYLDEVGGAVRVYGATLGDTPLWSESDPSLDQAISDAFITDGALIASMRDATSPADNDYGGLIVYGLG